MSQRHEYARHIKGLYAQWFGFFVTTVLVAISSSFHASLDKDGKLVSPTLFYAW